MKSDGIAAAFLGMVKKAGDASVGALGKGAVADGKGAVAVG